MKNPLLLGLLATFLVTPSIVSAKRDNAEAAYKRNDVAVLKRMAEAGDPAAQHKLGFMYANGRGVTQDEAAAVSWYRKAADQGYANAQSNLGVMYANGQGVPQDYVQAHKWFNLGSARATAADDRDRNAKNRDEVAAAMTPAQIAEAQRLASAWKPLQ